MEAAPRYFFQPADHFERFGYPQAASAHDTFWDFISLMPESFHMIMWAMSDRAIPRSFRTIEGFGVHTFRFVNAKGQSKFVKFHWKPVLGLQSTPWDEAVKIAGADPDYLRRDLYEAIDAGDFPQWDLGIQGRPRPKAKATIKRTTPITSKILAKSAENPAMPPNPSSAAIRATTAKMMAHLNMIKSPVRAHASRS